MLLVILPTGSLRCPLQSQALLFLDFIDGHSTASSDQILELISAFNNFTNIGLRHMEFVASVFRSCFSISLALLVSPEHKHRQLGEFHYAPQLVDEMLESWTS
ncbi:unnamed protein product [Lactuca virosa]|uniref:Uncharacterized protein n=1 Tax=Lactuca virosa TaxID=75947 RepID=A0AAU9M604_9ASTR|nr:unnamed protein product [Lactuca virosa]